MITRSNPAEREVHGTGSSIVGGILLGWGSFTSLGCTIGNLLSGSQAFALSGWTFFLIVFGLYETKFSNWVEPLHSVIDKVFSLQGHVVTFVNSLLSALGVL